VEEEDPDEVWEPDSLLAALKSELSVGGPGGEGGGGEQGDDGDSRQVYGWGGPSRTVSRYF
jgi:hypothetical protein